MSYNVYPYLKAIGDQSTFANIIVQLICIFCMFMLYGIIILKYYVRICKVMS